MKYVKLAIVAIFAIVVAGCSQEQKPEPVSSSVESSSVVSSESSSSISSESSSSVMESSSESSASSEQPSEDAVKFTFHVGGQEIGSYTVNDAVGKSVLDAMKSNPEIVFTFNEADGVIDDMFGTKNDYTESKTWVYLLNDQMAEYGVVSQKLSAGDRIDWYFGTVDELPVKIIPAE
ncbi:DUF4430 domain-containing protein [Aerococcaceae bacterium NML210727]|nr:DUF4430 domain-containing protein [Aerococcaceae bacterium NML210727]MCW6660739.1 DUF4430 domain-containing protein [Aerococcaceae bacterium NML201209]